MNTRIVIVGNGNLSKKCFEMIKTTDYVIGVDRAALWLLEQGRIPDVAIGDFDSTTKEEFIEIKKSIPNILEYASEKDQTDMELAVVYGITRKPTNVLILGGTGSRMDHTLGALSVLELLLTAKIPHAIVNDTNRIRLIGRGCTILHSGEGYRYVSVLSYTKKIICTLTGFRYNVMKASFIRGSTRGVSNEISGGQAEVILHAGVAWVIESND